MLGFGKKKETFFRHPCSTPGGHRSRCRNRRNGGSDRRGCEYRRSDCWRPLKLSCPLTPFLNSFVLFFFGESMDTPPNQKLKKHDLFWFSTFLFSSYYITYIITKPRATNIGAALPSSVHVTSSVKLLLVTFFHFDIFFLTFLKLLLLLLLNNPFSNY